MRLVLAARGASRSSRACPGSGTGAHGRRLPPDDLDRGPRSARRARPRPGTAREPAGYRARRRSPLGVSASPRMAIALGPAPWIPSSSFLERAATCARLVAPWWASSRTSAPACGRRSSARWPCDPALDERTLHTPVAFENAGGRGVDSHRSLDRLDLDPVGAQSSGGAAMVTILEDHLGAALRADVGLSVVGSSKNRLLGSNGEGAARWCGSCAASSRPTRGGCASMRAAALDLGVRITVVAAIAVTVSDAPPTRLADLRAARGARDTQVPCVVSRTRAASGPYRRARARWRGDDHDLRRRAEPWSGCVRRPMDTLLGEARWPDPCIIPPRGRSEVEVWWTRHGRGRRRRGVLPTGGAAGGVPRVPGRPIKHANGEHNDSENS